MTERQRVLDLFCGSKSIGNEAGGKAEVITIDKEESYNPTFVMDILKPFDVFWASPPCTFFSVASIGKHWNQDHTPKSKEALVGLEILDRTIGLISVLKPKHWFIENPRGKMRKIIDPIFKKYGISDYIRHTVTYCQYGDNRMKPTDIWTNNKKWQPKAICKNGDSCHESAPRGAKTGTQGLKGSFERSRIPDEFCHEIIKICGVGNTPSTPHK